VRIGGRDFTKLINETLHEQQWNKDSDTPRDYSKEYNKPGSKEQDERNKRKRDKRKHDKEHGECPEETELHHVNGVESDEVECQPVAKNRGRKEKSRIKDGEIVIRITEEHVRQIVQEETEEVLQEILPALAALATRGAAMAGSGLTKAASAAVKVSKPMAKKAAKALVKSTTKKIAPVAKKMAKKIGGTKVGSYQGLEDMIDQVLGQASDEDLKGNPNQLINKLKQSMPYLQHLKGGAKE
tara:strand:+ start:1037 stop:1759 length:723 start_codon:yes stop_codon:yes gene_type:complete